MILMIDNYDSFVYNLNAYFEELGAQLRVCRNDALKLSDIRRMNPSGIVISPGPGTPEGAGLSCSIVREFYREIPDEAHAREGDAGTAPGDRAVFRTAPGFPGDQIPLPGSR